MPDAVAGTEPDQLLALRTAAEAIADAGGDDRLPDRNRIGVIIGRGGYITAGQRPPRPAGAHQPPGRSPCCGSSSRASPPTSSTRCAPPSTTSWARPAGESSIGLVPNFAASRVANRFDFRGPAYTVDAACASSLVAVDHAVRELALGPVRRGAGRRRPPLPRRHPVERLHPAQGPQPEPGHPPLRPAGRRHAHVGGHRASSLLKRLADAERDGDRVYAVIRGTGVASDGRASSLMSPLSDGQVLAVEQAWREAGLDPTAADALGLLEAHGTATPAGDQVELETLARVFGRRGRGGEPVGAGLGEVDDRPRHARGRDRRADQGRPRRPPRRAARRRCTWRSPTPPWPRTRFRPVTELEPWDRADRPRPAGRRSTPSASAGSTPTWCWRRRPAGGPVPAARPTASSRRRAPGERVLLLAASTADELARQLGRLRRRAAGRGHAAGDRTRGRAGAAGDRRPDAPHPGPGPQGRRPGHAVAGPQRPVVHRRPPSRRPDDKIAFLFPGFEPEFEPRVDDVADHFRLARPNLSGGDELVERSLDIIAVGRLLADALGAHRRRRPTSWPATAWGSGRP